jgi:hypothetical protein
MTTPSTFHRDLTEFISDPTPATFNRLLRLLSTLTITMPIQCDTADLVHVRSARCAMATIHDRWERVGTMAITSLDALTLRAAAPFIAEAFGRTRLDVFSFANALVLHRMEQEGVVFSD